MSAEQAGSDNNCRGTGQQKPGGPQTAQLFLQVTYSAPSMHKNTGAVTAFCSPT